MEPLTGPISRSHVSLCVCACVCVPTVDPGNHDAFPESLPQQGHSTGRVVVEQLEDVHSALQRQLCLKLRPFKTPPIKTWPLKPHTLKKPTRLKLCPFKNSSRFEPSPLKKCQFKAQPVLSQFKTPPIKTLSTESLVHF